MAGKQTSDQELLVDSQAGERLDRALQECLPGLSRAAVQRLIEEGRVRVNGKRERSGYRLRTGERVEWETPPPDPEPSAIQPEALPLDVVYEDEDLLVINKS